MKLLHAFKTIWEHAEMLSYKQWTKKVWASLLFIYWKPASCSNSWTPAAWSGFVYPTPTHRVPSAFSSRVIEMCAQRALKCGKKYVQVISDVEQKLQVWNRIPLSFVLNYPKIYLGVKTGLGSWNNYFGGVDLPVKQ